MLCKRKRGPIFRGDAENTMKQFGKKKKKKENVREKNKQKQKIENVQK